MSDKPSAASSGCGQPITYRQWNTRCVLDRDHPGPCQNYAQVLMLDSPLNHPTKRKVGKRG